MTRLRLAAVWVGLQLVFFAGWAAREESRLTTGTSVLVRIVPVDPRDLLRGQFMRLGYRFSRPWDSTAARVQFTPGSVVWVVLRPDGEYHEPVRLSSGRPGGLGPGEVAIRGQAYGRSFEFGVEHYYVPEGTPTPRAQDLTARLRVDPFGVVRLQQVYLRGTPWPPGRGATQQ